VVDLGMRILRGQDAVAAVTIRATRGGFVSSGHGSSMHALPIEFDGMPRMGSCAARETAGCCGRRRRCRADSFWPRARPPRLQSESDALARGKTCSSVRPDHPSRRLARVCSGGIPSLRRHGIARTLLEQSGPQPSPHEDCRGRIGKPPRLTRYERCRTRGKPRRRGHVEHSTFGTLLGWGNP